MLLFLFCEHSIVSYLYVMHNLHYDLTHTIYLTITSIGRYNIYFGSVIAVIRIHTHDVPSVSRAEQPL